MLVLVDTCPYNHDEMLCCRISYASIDGMNYVRWQDELPCRGHPGYSYNYRMPSLGK